MDEAHLRIQPDIATIREARAFLAKHFEVTRLVAAPFLSERTGKRVYLKLETELPTGSFKVRGALYALATKAEEGRRRRSDCVEHGESWGGGGVCGETSASQRGFFCQRDVIRVTGQIGALGAEIVEAVARTWRRHSNWRRSTRSARAYILNDATDVDLPAGPATIECEIARQLPEVGSIGVPMGDTALIRGIAAAAKQLAPYVKIIGVQAERAPAYYQSWKEDRIVGTETCDTIADGLATRTPEAANVRDIRSLVDEVVLVSEEQMLRAIDTLLMDEHVLAEPAGAASTSALLGGGANFGEKVVLIVSGANVSREVLRREVGAV